MSYEFEEEKEYNVSDAYRSPQIQTSMRVSLEVIAKLALLAKKFNLTYPNVKTPDGKFVYNMFIRTMLFTLLDPYFTHSGGNPPVCEAPKTDEEINAIIFQLQEGRLDQPIAYPLSKGEIEAAASSITDDKALDDLIKAMNDDDMLTNSKVDLNEL